MEGIPQFRLDVSDWDDGLLGLSRLEFGDIYGFHSCLRCAFQDVIPCIAGRISIFWILGDAVLCPTGMPFCQDCQAVYKGQGVYDCGWRFVCLDACDDQMYVLAYGIGGTMDIASCFGAAFCIPEICG